MPTTLSIYLCSDREDAEAERDYLHARVFPDLIARAAGRGIDLDIADPHRDDRNLAQAIELLDSRPTHALALVGAGYGAKLDFFDLPFDRMPEGFRQTVIDGASRFHIEVALAILHDEKTAKVSGVFVREPTPDAPARSPELEPLVERLRKTGAFVAPYRCRWDAAAKRFDEFEALGRAVEDWIAGLIAVAAGDETKSTQIQMMPLPRHPAPAVETASDDLAMLSSPKAEAPRGNREDEDHARPHKGSMPSPVPAPQPAPVEVDENVQFTVYRPKSVPPEKWNDLLAFAHLSEKPPDAPADEPNPVEEVKRQAKQLLGDKAAAYQSSTQDSFQAVPKRGEITFLPEMKGVDFNPPRRTFVWQESVHREEFRFKADRSLDGTTARGKLSIFHGAILLGDVALAIKIDSTPAPSKIRPLLDTGEATDLEPIGATRYRKIFASYSHKDLAIVEQFEAFAEAMGDEYLRDWKHLRAGERWQDKLMKMIREADVFQLFWSKHSMLSPFVRQEWEYALSLSEKGPSFVRPTYWEEPMPTSAAPPLPPPDLAELHFQRLSVPAKSKPKMLPPTEADFDLLRAAPNETPTAVEIALPPDSDVSLRGSVNRTELDLSLEADSHEIDWTVKADSTADSGTVDADEEMPTVPQDEFAATESDLDLSGVDDAGSQAVSLDDDEATLDESNVMIDWDSEAAPEESVNRSRPKASSPREVSAPMASMRDDYEESDDVKPRVMAKSMAPSRSAPAKSSGSSEAIKIILGVLFLCAVLVGLLILVTGRIPFVK
jgi:TIR domain